MGKGPKKHMVHSTLQPQQSSIPLLQGTMALVHNGQCWTHEKLCALCNQITTLM